ncbi:hypothetical protein J1TS3_07420 [Siminovitchia fordii]|uniref:Uncharacterized protein n=1 Tax=Siminovitchia fordii TaxID=254759 RepID=A0ABQ4K3B1_9BACI|nr:hypothetical protein J1TS3_07420 [Siminovitchia fordii]
MTVFTAAVKCGDFGRGKHFLEAGHQFQHNIRPGSRDADSMAKL